MRAAPTPRELLLRLDVYVDTADWWVGVYLGPTAIFICPLPCLVVRWQR